MKKYRVWECKIVISDPVNLPSGFDAPPRAAAIKAIEDAGFEIEGCFSGWGGSLSDLERGVLENRMGSVE